MKYLLVLVIAFVVIWIWKSERRADISEKSKAARDRKARKSNQKMVTTEVVACDVCGLHLPRLDALTGPGGVYCSDAHRRQAGAQ
jgi:uncharacterized protein